MAEFQEQVMGLTGLTIDASSTNPSRAEFTTFLTDGAKEIINILPPDLKEKCSNITLLYVGNTNTNMDMDGKGDILHVTRENADAGVHTPCRKIPAMYGALATDSTNMMYYATSTDPIYYITSDANDASTLYIYPLPTAGQPAIVYTASYPAVAYNDSVIANFPDEAEYLVTLYAAVKSIQSTMGAMNASIVHSDQDGTFTAANTSAQNQGWEQVRHWLENEEDSEMSGATISALNAELAQFVQEYQWYQSQQAKLQQDYDKGIQLLVSKGIPQQAQKQGAR